ncbi:hypothetical protein FB45DRAFT_1064847 [Roridomyces roridus]|uniref:DRBM domain-containing protein n=1 Tax=Roridomyces roridus TaxID=1738132 RepID=A0AAD7B950_9AGAR|nr:hypothetical protein FB45DRAFT_1064847 [Roridomyces roridus]
MSFISNASGITLGEGTFNNIHGNLVKICNHGVHDQRDEHGGESFLCDETHRNLILFSLDATNFCGSGDCRPGRREMEVDNGLKVIREKYLNLTLQIGSGPGYFLHAGEIKGRVVIVKVFNVGPRAREHLEATVLHSKGLMHPNVVRIQGRSLPTSSYQFIVYENGNFPYWKAAEDPLAVALRDDLERSIVLGFKLVAGLSSGINYLNVQGLTVPLRVENFNVFLDVNDRFLFSIDFPPGDPDTSENRDDANGAWKLFNALCHKVLRYANRVLHDEDIERTPVFDSSTPFLQSSTVPSQDRTIAHEEEQAMPNDLEEAPSVPPRREYVWRTMAAPQSLATIATQIARDLDVRRASINRLVRSDARSIHRCPGYVREEVTLATRAADSAVVSHDAPTVQEVCSVCHEVVNSGEVFSCVCGEEEPASRPTVKCRSCNSWSHRDCAPTPNDSSCQLCSSKTSGSPGAAADAQEQDRVAEAPYSDQGGLDFDQTASKRPADITADITMVAGPLANAFHIDPSQPLVLEGDPLRDHDRDIRLHQVKDASLYSGPTINNAQSPFKRSQLNNLAQCHGLSIEYSTHRDGPLHDERWNAIVYINGHQWGQGQGSNKKTAREAAAARALGAIAQGQWPPPTKQTV